MPQGSLLGIRRLRSNGPFIESQPSEEELVEFMEQNDLGGLPLTPEEVQALMKIDNKMLFRWLTGEMENFHNRAHNNPEQVGTIQLSNIIESDPAENYAKGIGAFEDLEKAREML